MMDNEVLQKYDISSDMIELCFQEAQFALQQGEVPVGCVFVHQGEVIAKAHNRTNELCSALKHAEMDCLEQIITTFGDDHGKILQQTVAVITLEPCLMCCRMLRMMKLKAVIYGARNDRFGGVGSVYNVDQHPAIKCPPLLCIAALSAQRAINLLQAFYEQDKLC